jgi:hypothetical protein
LSVPRARELDAGAIVEVLSRHGVKFIVIGGFAAIAQGSPLPTEDIDVVPATGQDNFSRLSAALTELDARVRAVELDEPLAFEHDAESLAASRIWNLTTRYGDLDITQMPSGTQGYDDLKRDAIDIEVAGVHICIASLADIVRSKEAAGRDKDRLALPVLRELVAMQLREKAGRPPAGPRPRKKPD